MIPHIFDIENGKIVVNVNCLLIPELKAVCDAYKNPIPALSFLHYMFDKKGPYCNVPEEDKEEILLQDFPGEYTLEDDVMLNSLSRLYDLHMTPSYRYYLDNKSLLEKIGRHIRDASITDGSEGNFKELSNNLKFVGNTITQFKTLEKTIMLELEEGASRTIGGRQLSYDQVVNKNQNTK